MTDNTITIDTAQDAPQSTIGAQVVVTIDPKIEQTRARFESKITRGETCWLWIGCTNSSGYGTFAIDHSRKEMAHRMAVLLSGRVLRSGDVVRHRCHNRLCVNPNHLQSGTPWENLMDSLKEGRDSWFKRNVPSTPTDPERDYEEEGFLY